MADITDHSGKVFIFYLEKRKQNKCKIWWATRKRLVDIHEKAPIAKYPKQNWTSNLVNQLTHLYENTNEQ